MNTSSPPRHARSRASRGRAVTVLATPASPGVSLVVLCGSLALVMGAMSSVATAVPEIGRATGATQGELTWIVDAYALVFAGLLLPCGALGDRYGRRRVLTWGLLVFAGASVLAPVGDDPHLLIVARGLAGLGAALVMPATLSLITTTMRGSAQERAVAVWVATATLGGSLGVVFSGLVLEFSDWRAIFYISAGAAGLLALAAVLVGESLEPGQPRMDLTGALTSAAAIGLVVFGINEAPRHGWGSAIVWGALLGGLAMGLAFVAVEHRLVHPLLDIRIFRSRRVLAGSVALTVAFGAVYGIFFLSMQYLQLIEGQTPLEAGSMMLPFGVTMIPASILAPRLVKWLGLRVVFGLGMVPMTVACVLFARVDGGEVELYLFAILLLGVSLGLVVTPATVAILRSVPSAKQGVASAVNDAVREVGAALGIAVVGSLLATGYSRELGPATDALPEPARGVAEGSLAGALQLGSELGPAAAPAVAEARVAFLSGMHGAYVVCAILIALCAAVIAAVAPGRTPDRAGYDPQ